MRGRQHARGLLGLRGRATPAGAGTTSSRPGPGSRCGSYPRGCGDDAAPGVTVVEVIELPPRVRGRPRGRGRPIGARGATPAGAGTTLSSRGWPTGPPSYPRGCGDDSSSWSSPSKAVELPPRVRGRPRVRGCRPAVRGATPAGAGTTRPVTGKNTAARSYPRGCGDDGARWRVRVTDRELPPRVRGRQGRKVLNRESGRATPAGAGTTARTGGRTPPGASYPRGCGDDAWWMDHTGQADELPPRVRGRRQSGERLADGRRATPAGAGTTSSRVGTAT